MAEEYLSHRDELALCIQLVDARHTPSKLDLQLNEWLIFHEKKHVVVATKSDKLSANELKKQLRSIGSEMPQSDVIPYSSTTGKRKDALWNKIEAALDFR